MKGSAEVTLDHCRDAYRFLRALSSWDGSARIDTTAKHPEHKAGELHGSRVELVIILADDDKAIIETFLFNEIHDYLAQKIAMGEQYLEDKGDGVVGLNFMKVKEAVDDACYGIEVLEEQDKVDEIIRR